VEYPRKADLRNDIYRPLPKIERGIIDPALITGDEPTVLARTALDAFNEALASNDADKLADCFYAEQAFWRDIVALTSHLRTIALARLIAPVFLDLVALRGIAGKIKLAGDAHLTVLNRVLVRQQGSYPVGIEANLDSII
jgi:hypothetical protein